MTRVHVRGRSAGVLAAPARALLSVALPSVARLCVALLTPGTLRGQFDVVAASVRRTPPTARAERSALDSLAAEASRRTARYVDRRAAVTDGYRRLGVDFPGMGEHWLHPAALLSGEVDAGRPTLLMYADVAGRPTLLGVGFVVVTRGDSARAAAPGWPAAWHEHSGLLADESGAGRGRAVPSGGGTRVWVLHAWTALANPDGPYAPDNWALPFVRVGLRAPARPDPDAGRAVSLVGGGDAYLRGVLADAGLAGETAAARVDSAVAASRARVAVLAARARAAGVVRPGVVAALGAEWRVLASALRAVIGPAVDVHLEPPHPHPPRNAADDAHHDARHLP